MLTEQHTVYRTKIKEKFGEEISNHIDEEASTDVEITEDDVGKAVDQFKRKLSTGTRWNTIFFLKRQR